MKEISPNIVIDPLVRFGKPIIKGTRITVEEALGFLRSGMTYDEIYQEYELTPEQLRCVIDYAAAFVAGENVQQFRTMEA
ncbi:DUF433 domain-containing protein [Candidatus Uhrbacteria bacterium]|nr:DUF433 domain-containing protein [Candidatus Uhrbacteria bacterium]